MGGLDCDLCLMCVRRYVCLLVGHPCCIVCVFHLLRLCVCRGGGRRSFGRVEERGVRRISRASGVRVCCARSSSSDPNNHMSISPNHWTKKGQGWSILRSSLPRSPKKGNRKGQSPDSGLAATMLQISSSLNEDEDDDDESDEEPFERTMSPGPGLRSRSSSSDVGLRRSRSSGGDVGLHGPSVLTSSGSSGSRFGFEGILTVAPELEGEEEELAVHPFFERQRLVTERSMPTTPIEERIREGPSFSFRRTGFAATAAAALAGFSRSKTSSVASRSPPSSLALTRGSGSQWFNKGSRWSRNAGDSVRSERNSNEENYDSATTDGEQSPGQKIAAGSAAAAATAIEATSAAVTGAAAAAATLESASVMSMQLPGRVVVLAGADGDPANPSIGYSHLEMVELPDDAGGDLPGRRESVGSVAAEVGLPRLSNTFTPLSRRESLATVTFADAPSAAAMEKSLAGPDAVINQQRKWLSGKLEHGVVSGLDSPMIYSRLGNRDLGRAGYQAACVLQARVRGRQCRQRHGDAVLTAVVVASARAQVDRCVKSAGSTSAIRLKLSDLASDGLKRRLSWRAQTSKRMSKMSSASTGTAVAYSSTTLESSASSIDKRGGTDPPIFDGFQPTPSMYARLARAQHWRVCPSCNAVVVEHGEDGSSQCTACLQHFRWAKAALYTPVTSLMQLRQETRWEHEERLRDNDSAPIGWRDVARLYWVHSDRARRSPIALAELRAYRALVFVPLVLSLPALTLVEQRRHAQHQRDSQKLHSLLSQPKRVGPRSSVDVSLTVALPEGRLPWRTSQSPKDDKKVIHQQPALVMVLPPAGAPPVRKRRKKEKPKEEPDPSSPGALLRARSAKQLGEIGTAARAAEDRAPIFHEGKGVYNRPRHASSTSMLHT